MNPSELRMMWMSQYNPERISLEDATSFFHPSSVGLSVVDDITQQQTTDLNPMVSLVGGEFGSHAAVAAAAAAANSAAATLGVQPATLLTANCNDIYGLAQMGSLHQQILQQSAAATMFQSYGSVDENDSSSNLNAFNAAAIAAATANATCSTNLPTQFITNEELQQQQQQQQQPQQQIYDQIDDDGYDDGVSDLTTKQEIINIDDFVMMTDSNSYDDGDLMQNDETSDDVDHINTVEDNELLEPISEQPELLNNSSNIISSSNILPAMQTPSSSAATGDSGSNSSSRSSGLRNQRKTRKIEPISRPGLVLKTPIAYKGNIDPSVIPIQKDGMAVCERCGAIGVKHTFYTKSRRFCSMACSRGELYSLVINNKSSNQLQPSEQQNQQQPATDDMEQLNEQQQQQQRLLQQQLPQSPQTDMELALRVSHLKNNHNHTNYRFRISNQTKITSENGFDEHSKNHHCNDNNNTNLSSLAVLGDSAVSAPCSDDGNESSLNAASSNQQSLQMQILNASPKELRMFRDIMPQEELPQIPKLDRLQQPCPQMEKIISIRRKLYDPTHSYDWTSRLCSDGFYAAPVTCFPHTPGYDVWDNLGISMKVEVENTDCDQTEVIQPGQTPHSFWVATILNIQGYKALMRYEGFDDESHDFWVNLCNAEVHSVGWCATRGKPLIPPRTIENKYKDWKDFLVFRLSGARTLPSSFYNKVNDSMQSRFRLGLNLECVDKDRISQVRLATVTKIVGKRLFLRYFDSDDGFWCHEDSPIIHPVGWATTVGHNLAAPQDYLERMLAGREAMIEVHEDDATIELFKMNFTFEEYYTDGKTNTFAEGMKLEAVDPLNLSSICAATVMAVLKFGYMMIRIDSYQPDATGSDWFCYHEKSPNIFPIGFCASNNISLTPPNGYDADTFNWQTYLHDTGSVPAAENLFHREVPNHGFEVGMSLECADLMDPRLVCVATVARVVGRLLKIHFDGWTDEYDQWLDCESPDIYPVGWCFLVNHKLEGPPTPVTTIPKITLKTKASKKRRKKGTNIVAANTKSPDNALQAKTRTIALKTAPDLPKLSMKLDIKSEHQNSACYEDANSIGVSDLTSVVNTDEYEEDSNSLQSNQSAQQIASSVATSLAAPMDVNTTTTTSSIMQTLKYPATITADKLNEKVRKIKKHTTFKKTTTTASPQTARRKVNSYRANLPCNNNKYIPRVCDSNESSSSDQTSELAPDTWSIYDVSQFLRVNDCTTYCDVFSRNKIDGKHLLQLSKDETITLLGMKVGPAIKIFDLIQQLKCKMNPSKSRLNKNKYL